MQSGCASANPMSLVSQKYLCHAGNGLKGKKRKKQDELRREERSKAVRRTGF
jgi:hypothetical protein